MSLSHNVGLSGDGAIGVCCLDAAASRDLRISSLGHMTEFGGVLPEYGICAISRGLLGSVGIVGCIVCCRIFNYFEQLKSDKVRCLNVKTKKSKNIALTGVKEI